jgi:hypothetical protein
LTTGSREQGTGVSPGPGINPLDSIGFIHVAEAPCSLRKGKGNGEDGGARRFFPVRAMGYELCGMRMGRLARARTEFCGRKGWRVEVGASSSGFLRQAQDRLFDCATRRVRELLRSVMTD